MKYIFFPTKIPTKSVVPQTDTQTSFLTRESALFSQLFRKNNEILFPHT